MRLVAALVYYAELPEHLTRCVRSLRGVVDHLEAWQGPWAHFPELPGDDPEEQEAAVGTAAAGAMSYHHVSGTWPSQVDKRSQLMQAAGEQGDWVLVIDADEWVGDVAGALLRAALDDTRRDVAEVTLHREPHEPATRPRPVRRIYRAATGLSVRTAHMGYVTADGRFLHGNPGYVKLEPSELSTAPLLQLHHDVACRTHLRRRARDRYLYTRRDQALESWLPERRAASA